MATTATAQWWIRTDGAVTGGAGYDSGIAGAATNYCDQAAAQASWADLQQAVAGTITDHGATGLFTAAMIGNAINVVGQGYYWITGRTDANTVTVTAGTGAAATFTAGKAGKVGGALAAPVNLNNGGSVSAPGTASALVAGNRINIRASGSGSVGSPDYTQAGYAQYPSGDTTSGYISWVAYNGTPYFKGDGLSFFSISYHRFTGIYFTVSAANFGTFGIIGQNSSSPDEFINCTFDANNQAVWGINGSSSGNACGIVQGCEFTGGGTTSLTAIGSNMVGLRIKNCKIHGWGGWGILENANSVGTQISNCTIYSNTTGGVSLITISNVQSLIDGCTIDNNGSDGIKIASTAAAAWSQIVNSNVTNNSGYGINVAAGTAATNTAAIAYEDYNNVYNNTSGAYHNLNAGAHDLNVNPTYS